MLDLIITGFFISCINWH